MASPPTCLVFHLKRMIKTHHNRRLSRSSRRLVRWFSSSPTYDDSISPHGVSSSGGRCLQFGDQLLDLSKHMLHRQLKQLDSNEESSLSSSADMEKNINDLKGKDLLKRLHEVGTLAQISSIQGDQVILVGHRRLRITEKVSEEPLTVKVDHLKDKPFDMDDDVIKATSFEVISTLRDVHKRLRLTLELMKKKKGKLARFRKL
ncbi:BnaC05g12420D [Brassica napus]|uniref:BnaC05g12420D protein n=1 Tax=Brassica napus TaxID=3708 RepID=A0A078H644_BRANA|nr:BnaC05g12420D [Brassica napus]